MKTTIQKIRNRLYNITQETNLLLQPDIVIFDERHLQEIEKLEWISVSDKLPPEDETVHVVLQCTYKSERLVAMSKIENKIWFMYTRSNDWIVTHWRPQLALPDLEDECS